MTTSGNIAKANILKANRNNEKLKAVLRFVYNPYNKCCLGQAKLAKAMQRVDASDITDPLLVIKYLNKNNTGSDDAANFAAAFIQSVVDANNDITYIGPIAAGFVTQDIQMGLGVKSLNDIFGDDFIPTVGCMLGTEQSKVKNIKWPCIVTEKLDGIRRILIKENGVVRMFSRSGHEDTGCVDIIAEAKYLPNNYVYDGELLAIGSFKDNIAWRQATNSIANSSGIKHDLSFNVFDMLPLDEFYAGRSKMNALNRKILLGATFDDSSIAVLTPDWSRYGLAYRVEYDFSFIKPVPILGLVHNMDQVTPIVDAIWRQHGEGVMLNTVTGFYEIKRSKELIKVKFSEDITLPIIDFIEGDNSWEGMLGSFVVNYKGARVGVSGRLSMQQRQEIWNNKSKYIGKKIEIETFGESTNQAGQMSLNCPIFKRFAGQEE
jgi:DNA ligase-1